MVLVLFVCGDCYFGRFAFVGWLVVAASLRWFDCASWWVYAGYFWVLGTGWPVVGLCFGFGGRFGGVCVCWFVMICCWLCLECGVLCWFMVAGL